MAEETVNLDDREFREKFRDRVSKKLFGGEEVVHDELRKKLFSSFINQAWDDKKDYLKTRGINNVWPKRISEDDATKLGRFVNIYLSVAKSIYGKNPNKKDFLLPIEVCEKAFERVQGQQFVVESLETVVRESLEEVAKTIDECKYVRLLDSIPGFQYSEKR